MAHRGGAIEHLENSMPAFEACVAMGYRYLETDVRVTADGVPVVFHDPTLDRVTDRTGRVDQLPWSELAGARIGGREPVLRLEDLLGAWPDIRFNLDIKAPGVVAPLARTVRRLGVADRICLGSFSDKRVPRPAACSGPGCAPRWARAGSRRCGCPPTPPAPPAWCTSRPAARRCPSSWAAGRWWTSASSPQHTLAAAGARLDGGHRGRGDGRARPRRGRRMTDRPAMLRDLLERRGQWTPR
jgi:glycerophosphoryl diester phosphodiesterase